MPTLLMRTNERVPTAVYLWVTAVAVTAAVVLAVGRDVALPFPGAWAVGSFALVALLLDQTGGDLRVGATGSTSFVVHLSAGILFGPFWGGLITGVSTAAGQAIDKRPAIKILFNASQRTIAVAGGLLILRLYGIQTPLLNFTGDTSLVGRELQGSLGYFLVYAGFYFGFNTAAVSAVVALSSGRRFIDIWNLNAKGVIGYDLAASFISVVLSWLYVVFDQSLGFGALGFVLTLAPILVIRHIYGLYRRLQSSGRELLDLMVKAIEARDPYTSGHSIRVATLAKSIAQEVKVGTEAIEEVYTAAILHDVGKIHEEFAPLLRKETKLTPEETALLQTHAAKSAELVGIISSFRGAIQNAVRSHHERWDGGGYPDGIAGEEIPLGARIIMISDTADAMMTDRPYRKRLPIDAVIGELQKYRGTQFDPKLVDLVINSVAIRRVMAELQSGSKDVMPPSSEGGSKRVIPPPPGILRGRTSWPRIRAF